jgi:hypothetical protein
MHRTYGGPLIDMEDAIAAQNAGMKAIVLKCHHENTVSRAYLVQRMVPNIKVFGGVVLNSYVGGINPAAVEAALRLGGVEVWMPTIDAGYHAQIHGGTGGYDAQQGGRAGGEGIWIQDKDGRLKPEVVDVLKLIAEHGAILGTCHLSPDEIMVLVAQARELGVEKIVVTHPFFKVPKLTLQAIEELVRLGAMPEFGYCTVSPAWQYSSPEIVAEAILRVGASRCLLVSDTGQRHNPLPSEALRVFAQTLFERGIEDDKSIRAMISNNPYDLLDLDSRTDVPSDADSTWARALAHDPCQAGPGVDEDPRVSEGANARPTH